MLQLDISESTRLFRAELREWLAKNPPPQVTLDSALEVFEKTGRAWQQQLASGGWVGVNWPKEYGGRGHSLVEAAIVQEELVGVAAPQLLGLFGLTMVGPVLIAHGSAAQKHRFLSKILKAEEIWCQGFSEPGAGSDLAAIKCKAVPVDGGFSVSGQKIWTSFAHIADWCFLLARTSDEAKRHQGLSYLLVDMRSPGITVRPLKQITGDEEFNEVFFENVFVPHDNVVGKVGAGWEIAISTLMYERVVLTFARQLQSEVALRAMVAKVKGARGSEHEVDRVLEERLGFEVARACAVRALAYKHLLSYAHGKQPGPEGSLDKLLWSESFQEIAKIGVELESDFSRDGQGAAINRYLYSRGRTIAAGTSEIQRNIIAERLLDLPRLKYTNL